MSAFESRLDAELDRARAHWLQRDLQTLSRSGYTVEAHGRRWLNLAGNDYLGLGTHPRLKQAAAEAIERQGVGAGASRVIVGHLDTHDQVERQFAHFKHAQAALLLPTGFMANLAVLTTLPWDGDVLLLDKLNHASLIDAGRYSPATVRVFPHRHYDKLERLLERFTKRRDEQHASQAKDKPTAFIVTDSVFSMDGDCADLGRLCDLAEKYEAVLVVDEAHGTGVLGPNGAGLAEQQHLSDRIDITISTASKALGGLGGIVTGSQRVIDTLIQRARPFLYTTAAPPAQAAAISAALEVIRDEPWRRQRLAQLSKQLRDALPHALRSAQGQSPQSPPTPIIPLFTGSTESALTLACQLHDQGIFAPAIRSPTVARGQERVRLSLRADLTDEDLARIIEALGACEKPGK